MHQRGLDDVTELLAAAALGVGEQIHDRNRAIVADNITLARDFFADYPDLFTFDPPLGGCVCFPRYLGADGSDTFAQRLVQDAGVLTLPSGIYTSSLALVPTDRIRIGLGRTSLETILTALRRYLDERPA